MKKIVVFLMLVSTLYSSEIKVAMASNTSFVMKKLIKEFNKKNPNIEVVTILGSSGKLFSQIVNKAPFDIYLSADMNYAEELYSLGYAANKPEIYAKGNIVVLSLKSRDFSDLFKLLTNKKINKIAIASPKTAPYGKASKESLKNMKVYNKIESKLIYAQSIAQTLFYTTKITDLGIVSKSSLYDFKMAKFKESINWVDIPKNLYKPINQGIVIIKNSKNMLGAKKFYDFILSTKAKKIFKDYGYSI